MIYDLRNNQEQRESEVLQSTYFQFDRKSLKVRLELAVESDNALSTLDVNLYARASRLISGASAVRLKYGTKQAGKNHFPKSCKYGR
jgi:hypothetical protein